MADLASTRVFGKLTVMHDAIVKANAEIMGSVAAASFAGNGSLITALNAAALATGTVPSARLPTTATRWPTFAEVTSKPTTFAPSAHSHPWSEVTGRPATADRWPTFAEVTSKPATYPPDSHNHDGDYLGITAKAQDSDKLGGKQLTTIEADYKAYAVQSENGLSWSIVTANTTASAKKGYLIDCSTGPITLTLPVSPVEGDTVGVSDFTKNSKINAITVARNGKNITGLAENLVVNINGAGFVLVFTNATVGWEVVSEVGIQDIYYPYTHDASDAITTKSHLNVTGDLAASASVSAPTVSADAVTADTLDSVAPEITVNSNLTVNGVITETSSIRYKSNVRALNGSLDSIMNLMGVMYDRSSDEKDNTGFIAEEVEKVMPNIITYKDGQVEGIKYTQLIAYLVESIKELNDKIECRDKEVY